MHIFFQPQARDEALEAQAWYESRAAGLGLEFARALDAAIAAAVRNPEMFTFVTGDCRRVLLRRTPGRGRDGKGAPFAVLAPLPAILPRSGLVQLCVQADRHGRGSCKPTAAAWRLNAASDAPGSEKR